MSATNIIEIKNADQIPSAYRGTPIELLLKYQNLNAPHEKYQQAQMLIGMCIDYRKHLNTPENFAYMIRSVGANLRMGEFKVAFAVAVGGVSTIALIGHTQCGMVNLASKKEQFIQGLVDRAGWTRQAAEAHFLQNVALYDIADEADFVHGEARRLRAIFPKVLIVPMLYRVEDGLLYLIREDGK